MDLNVFQSYHKKQKTAEAYVPDDFLIDSSKSALKEGKEVFAVFNEEGKIGKILRKEMYEEVLQEYFKRFEVEDEERCGHNKHKAASVDLSRSNDKWYKQRQTFEVALKVFCKQIYQKAVMDVGGSDGHKKRPYVPGDFIILFASAAEQVFAIFAEEEDIVRKLESFYMVVKAVTKAAELFSQEIYGRVVRYLRGSDHNKQKQEPYVPDDFVIVFKSALEVSIRLFAGYIEQEKRVRPVAEVPVCEEEADREPFNEEVFRRRVWDLGLIPPDQFETFDKYSEQVCSSDGFEVTDYPNCPRLNIPHRPTPIDNTPSNFHYVKIIAAATLAIYHYNHRVDPLRCFVLSKLLSVTSTPCNGFEFRITFEAMDDQAGLKTFQAQVYHTYQQRFEVRICRLKDENKNLEKIPFFPPTLADCTYSDWRSSEQISDVPLPPFDNNSPPCFKRLDDLDAKTAATMALLLLNYKLQLLPEKEYLFTRLVSASFTSTGKDRVCNVTFEATGREQDLNAARTFEAKVWQLYPSCNLEVEYCRRKNEKKGGSRWDAQ